MIANVLSLNGRKAALATMSGLASRRLSILIDAKRGQTFSSEQVESRVGGELSNVSCELIV